MSHSPIPQEIQGVMYEKLKATLYLKECTIISIEPGGCPLKKKCCYKEDIPKDKVETYCPHYSGNVEEYVVEDNVPVKILCSCPNSVAFIKDKV